MTSTTPSLSVVVPVRNDPERLAICLEALARSSLENHEVIVVDDASDDQTPEVARRHGARVIIQKQRTGPGLARNRGVEAARADIVLFVDADVVVSPRTLARVERVFQEDHDLDAVFGTYDANPASRNFVSQYRNLVHRFFHVQGAGVASTFWAGCGAIRRKVFQELEGFRARFGRPSIEDIELGARLHRQGGKILLDPEIEVQHLKQWRLGPMVICDVFHRGIPWTREMLRAGSVPDTLNLEWPQRWSAVLTGFILILWIVMSVLHPPILALPFVVLLVVAAVDHLAPHGVNHWFGAVLSTGLMGAVAAAVVWIGWLSPVVPLWIGMTAALILPIIVINRSYYRFFVRCRGIVFTMLVLPLHLLYYVYSSAAFVVGVVAHRSSVLLGSKR